jgi:uncharacterized protein YoxC
MIIEICLALIAVAFIALVIYVIVMINALRSTLHQVDKTLIEVRRQLDDIGPQAQKAIEHANQVSFDLKRKMESLNPIFNTLFNVGEILEHKSFALKKEGILKENRRFESDIPVTVREYHAHEELKVADVFELVGIAIRLWQKFKKKSFGKN